MLRLSSTLRLDDCMSEKEREKKEKKKKLRQSVGENKNIKYRKLHTCGGNTLCFDSMVPAKNKYFKQIIKKKKNDVIFTSVAV